MGNLLVDYGIQHRVQNLIPTVSAPYRIAIVGEAPGAEEETAGEPFVGASGRLLMGVMSRVGLARAACFLGNVCQIRPPGNDITQFERSGPEITTGLEQLDQDLAAFKPNLVLCLGRTALWAATGDDRALDSWRGSVFISPRWQCKCMATYHPAAVLRQYEWIQLFRFDLHKAAEQAKTPEYRRLERTLAVDVTLDYIIARIRDIREKCMKIAIDIEGGINSMSCISVATSPVDAFIIPFIATDGGRYWSFEDEMIVWRELSGLLADADVPKVLQNALYDLFVLAYSYNIHVSGVVDDTMLKHWELLCEMEKSLAVQTSLYTDEPYYKFDRSSGPGHTLWRYCCMDSAITFEINEKLESQLSPDSRRHYKFNVACLAPLLYAELRGFRYDAERARELVARTKRELFELQHEINRQAGSALPNDRDTILDLISSKMLYKRRPPNLLPQEWVMYAKKDQPVMRAVELVQGELTPAALGELSVMLGVGLNVNSTPQMCKFLYTQLAYETQYKKLHGKLTNRPTTDELAILTLYRKSQGDQILLHLLRLRKKYTALETLEAKSDPDGRIRGAYNIVGTETGRLSAYTSPTGSGYNLQTVTKKHRVLFCADEDKWLFQCDLAGADGWTVAAHSARLGDRTMLDDYLAGLKPARNVALMHTHGTEAARWPREKLKELGKTIDSEGWLYFSSKRVQHGVNYGMKERTMSDQILKDSYKLSAEGVPTFVQPVTCGTLARYYLTRYSGISAWHRDCADKLRRTGQLKSASGHTRIFFGRREDYDTLKEFLAHEPQNNTTYATNLALLRMWLTPENRREDGSLRVEPIHQVHDAVIGQFRKNDVEFALPFITQCFDNQLTIAGQKITIPFEGKYGPSWGELTHDIH